MNERPAKLSVRTREDGALEILVPAPPANVAPADELLPLRAAGVEVKALHALERRGLLKIAHIGRKLYVRRTELLAAFDALAIEQRAERDARAAVTSGDSYGSVVALERHRRRGAA